MKIAVVGASGNAGSRIAAETRPPRPHRCRHRPPPRKDRRLAWHHGQAGDVMDSASLTQLLAGHDAAVSSVHFTASDPARLIGPPGSPGSAAIWSSAEAGSLEVAPGVPLVTTPGFPVAYKAEAEKGAAFLDLLRQEKELNWTFLSPSALFVAGERTGKFRLGDRPASDRCRRKKARFPSEDFAVALADEIEHPAHIRKRFYGRLLGEGLSSRRPQRPVKHAF